MIAQRMLREGEVAVVDMVLAVLLMSLVRAEEVAEDLLLTCVSLLLSNGLKCRPLLDAGLSATRTMSRAGGL